MNSAKIMPVRHAERPNADKTIRSVSQEGEKTKEELIVRGWQRAGALVRFFATLDNHFAHPILERPDILFACCTCPTAPRLRPQHGLLPLAELIQVEFNRSYFEGKEEALVQKALTAKGAVLIAWKHRTMHVIANAILGNKTAAPQYWPLDRVDLVWVFERKGESWTFTQVPQLLLAGGRQDGIE
ncbi:MAG TPA: histidine phosphatase family protein [Methylocella sp.]|nr:histidine phosphatase family protein [Methylocella sp.]